jgi:3-methyladenine DNA glycosylase/8-oxoguanine DNA glycosylase
MFSTTQPFGFRHTFWKPSHFATGLELHTADVSWRTFRLGEACVGVRFEMKKAKLKAAIFADQPLDAARLKALELRIQHAYGLRDDLTQFLAIASTCEAMQEPLAAMAGMRQSCPETLFEISVISLLLQNATIQRTTQMMSNLLHHYGRLVEFEGILLRALFTPKDVMHVTEEKFRTLDRLGYRAKYIGRFAEFFGSRSEVLILNDQLRTEFLRIKGVGPYTAAIVGSHASRDPSALGLDVWNRKILAQRLLSVEDADPDRVRKVCTSLFPGHEGLAALYIIEHAYLERPVGQLLNRNAIPSWNAAIAGEGHTI